MASPALQDHIVVAALVCCRSMEHGSTADWSVASARGWRTPVVVGAIITALGLAHGSPCPAHLPCRPTAARSGSEWGEYAAAAINSPQGAATTATHGISMARGNCVPEARPAIAPAPPSGPRADGQGNDKERNER